MRKLLTLKPRAQYQHVLVTQSLLWVFYLTGSKQDYLDLAPESAIFAEAYMGQSIQEWTK